MSKYVRYISLILIDAILISISVYLSYMLRFDFVFSFQNLYMAYAPYVALFQAIATIVCFNYFKIYKRMWQYASVDDLVSIMKATFWSTGFFYIFHHFIFQYVNPHFIIPRSIYVLTLITIIFAVGGSRFIWRMIKNNFAVIRPHHSKTLIIGAGNAGNWVVKELKYASNSQYYPVAFIDDDPNKVGQEILGIPVLGSRETIHDVVKQRQIEQIIVAMPHQSKDTIAEILEICKQTGCQVKIIPSMGDIISGKASVSLIRDVSVEDLLGRDPVNVDLYEISDYIHNKAVLVTGAGGSIGSELCRQICKYNPKEILLFGHGENSIYDIDWEIRKDYPEVIVHALIGDIQDQGTLKQVFEQHRPQVVFHAAAHKHVPLMEKHPKEAVKNNILGTKNVALTAHEFGVERFVLISSDKAVNPANVMGATKRVCELIIQALNQISETKFVAVRFGNVLGSRGSVIPLFKKQIEEGGPVTVTHPEMIRYFMTIPEAVQLVIQAGALANGGEIFVLDMGKPVKIYDLAVDLIRLSGLEPEKDIEIKFTGIRPGEKLFEEIMTSEEGVSATKHNRIYVSKPSEFRFDEINFYLKRLEQSVANDSSSKQIKEMLTQIVPAYQGDGNQTHEDLKQKEKALQEALRSSLELVATIDSKSQEK